MMTHATKDSGQAHNTYMRVCWCYCRAAALLRPDSNVPNNNIANSYLSLERVDDALDEAKEAFRRKIDYMTSVTCLSHPTTLSMCRRLSMLVLLSQFLAPSFFLSHSLSLNLFGHCVAVATDTLPHHLSL